MFWVLNAWYVLISDDDYVFRFEWRHFEDHRNEAGVLRLLEINVTSCWELCGVESDNWCSIVRYGNLSFFIDWLTERYESITVDLVEKHRFWKVVNLIRGCKRWGVLYALIWFSWQFNSFKKEGYNFINLSFKIMFQAWCHDIKQFIKQHLNQFYKRGL